MSGYQRATVEWPGGFAETIVKWWMPDALIIDKAIEPLPLKPSGAKVTSRIMLNKFEQMMQERREERNR